MLTTSEIQRHLARLSYRPGWSLTAYDGDWEGQHIVITAKVEDSYNPGEWTVLDVHSALPPMPDTAYLERWLQWRLIRLESHEAREFLHRDGRPIFDPHAEHAERDSTTYDPSTTP